MTFAELGLSADVLRAVTAEGYETPTPIQAQSIPHVLAGRDVLGSAQTGTGKTAAFALPMLHRLNVDAQPRRRGRPFRALILAPTRELACQIQESFRTYGKFTRLRFACVYGGVSQHPQTKSLREGVDVLIATPGRLFDLWNQGFIDFSGVEIFVLDEADRMLDMGFIDDIRRIVAALPAERQTLFFSATMPPEIRDLANSILREAVPVQVAANSAAADTVEQFVYFVDPKNKPALLRHFVENAPIGRALIFTRTKHGADRVATHLDRAGIPAEAIHGDKSQAARKRALDRFKRGHVRILVATDIAARGLDVDGITHVINYELSNDPETYVHRIGRTGRAGQSGEAVTFCGAPEYPMWRTITRLVRTEIAVIEEHPEIQLEAAPRLESAPGPRRGNQRRPFNNNGRRPAMAGKSGGRRFGKRPGGDKRMAGAGAGRRDSRPS